MRHFRLLIFTILLAASSQARAKTWVTLEDVQIDRCASAWFILRFLDPEAEFVFFKQGDPPPEGIGFDFFGAEYFHRGGDCTFTAFIKKHPRKDTAEQQALIEMEAIVNDVHAWRNGPESLAVKTRELIDLIKQCSEHDTETMTRSQIIFDFLFTAKTEN